MTKPLISIIIVAYDMARELPRTVHSLLPPYQHGLTSNDIEIVIADNGSHEPVQRGWFPSEADIRIVRVNDGGVSPCRALNAAFAQTTADQIGIIIDGARMVTPGLLRTSLMAARIADETVVSTLHFHLGPKVQQVSVTEGYSRAVEDELLRSIDWPKNGYGLFDISCLGESAKMGVASTPFESNFSLLSRRRYETLGGYDERFTQLGGGLANWDFYRRAILSFPEPTGVLLIGEANFHQLHFGATTQEGGVRRPTPTGSTFWDAYLQEYEAVRGEPYRSILQKPMLYGSMTHPRVAQLYFPQAVSLR